MLLRAASDLHLEFTRDINYTDSLIPTMNKDKDTVLALLGDIHVGTGARFFLKEMSERFKAVIYVLGNHEFYNYKFYDLKHEISDMFVGTNVYVLENESITIDNKKFVGATLWTDMEKQHPGSILNVGNGINDYHLIQSTDGKKLKPSETIAAHLDSVNYLSNNIDKDSIVLTHHAPVIGCSDPQFKDSRIKGGFESDLADLILETQPKYWLYGHTHYNKRPVFMGDTMLLSNQVGYPTEHIIKYNPIMVLEV